MWDVEEAIEKEGEQQRKLINDLSKSLDSLNKKYLGSRKGDNENNKKRVSPRVW